MQSASVSRAMGVNPRSLHRRRPAYLTSPATPAEIRMIHESPEDLVGQDVRWFDYWLKGKTNGVDRDAPVKIFVMGDNRWRDEAAWPLKRTRSTALFLTGGGKANTPAGDGKLVW